MLSARVVTVSALIGLAVVLAAPRLGAVVDGDPADIREYPWTVALVEPGQAPINGQFCGGSLIAADWVLTAAHCVSGNRGRVFAPERVDVLLGRADLDRRGGQRVHVIDVQIHPDRVDPDLDIDIALIRLARPVDVLPVFLPDGSAPTLAPGTEARVLGWGVTRRGNDRQVDRGYSSEELLVTSVPIIEDRMCERATDADAIGARGFELCAGGMTARGGDSCLGDSGGPLVVAIRFGFVQVGVVAWSAKGCGLKHNPGVYTRVTSALEWIHATIGS